MADVHKPDIRSYNMSRIKGKDTKPEMIVRKFLHSNGFRYNLHGRFKSEKLLGKPDLVLPKHKTVILINGCFWHGHSGCKYFVMPKTRTEWWREKIAKTQSNDLKNLKGLENLGWRVLVIWECELKRDSEMALQKLISTIEK